MRRNQPSRSRRTGKTRVMIRLGVVGAVVLLMCLIVPDRIGAAGAEEESELRRLREHDVVLEISTRDLRPRLSVVSNDEKTRLWSVEDVRTSYTEVAVAGRTFRIGDSGRYTQEVREVGDALVVELEGAEWALQQRYTLAAEDNGVQLVVNLEIENRQLRTDLDIAVRYVFDTHFGEAHEAHFITGGGRVLEREAEIRAEERFVASIGTEAPGVGPVFRLDVGSEAKQVVAANHRRLRDARSGYSVRKVRGYDYFPRSVNDSAIALYYPEKRVQPGGTYELVTVIEIGTPERPFAPSVPVDDRVAERLPVVAPEPEDPDPEPAREDLLTDRPEDTDRPETIDPARELERVDELLAQIDELLHAEEAPSEEKVAEIRSLLNELERRRTNPQDMQAR